MGWCAAKKIMIDYNRNLWRRPFGVVEGAELLEEESTGDEGGLWKGRGEGSEEKVTLPLSVK